MLCTDDHIISFFICAWLKRIDKSCNILNLGTHNHNWISNSNFFWSYNYNKKYPNKLKQSIRYFTDHILYLNSAYVI
uniref:Uncharacterized protein n=1 Tax=Solanum lycopersicum TaxID=4081 RepID=A0A3Q7H3C1_SOLLC